MTIAIIVVTVMSSSISLYAVDAIVIMGMHDSAPIYAKYYSHSAHVESAKTSPKQEPPTVESQKDFQRDLLDKTGTAADVILYDNRVVVLKSEANVLYLVVGAPHENELLLHDVAVALKETLAILLRYACPAANTILKSTQGIHADL